MKKNNTTLSHTMAAAATFTAFTLNAGEPLLSPRAPHNQICTAPRSRVTFISIEANGNIASLFSNQ